MKTLTIILLLCATAKLFSQDIHLKKCKYCEDMGFGWYCIKFKNNGRYKEDGGHSYWANRTYGRWTNKVDTIICRPKRFRAIRPFSIVYRTVERTNSYYLFTKDSIYALYFDTETNRLQKSIALENWSE